MMYRLLSPHTNHRFFTLFCSELFELQILDQQWRFASNAAASEINNTDNFRTKKKIVSYSQRKQLVQAYVNQYRVMNAGKFPGVVNVQKHVGGSYYKVRAIYQEYEYSCKLTDGETTPINGISNCQLPDNGTADVEDRGISTKINQSYDVGLGKGICEIMDDVSTLNEHHEISTGSISGCGRKVDLENGEERDNIFADVDMSDEVNVLENPGVPVTSIVLENSLANETSTAFVKDDPKATARNLEPIEIDKSADEDFESDQSTRVVDVEESSNVLSEKTQVGDSYNKSSSKTQELDNSTMGVEMKRKGTITTKNDCHVSIDNDSTSQKEADNYSFQEIIDESILTDRKEVTSDICEKEKTADIKLEREDHKGSNANVYGGDYIGSRESEELLQQPSLMMDTSTSILKATTEKNEHSAKAGLLSEVPVTSQNSDIDENVASHQSSKSGRISQGTTVQLTTEKGSQESSLWGNVKLLASNIMSFWRKK